MDFDRTSLEWSDHDFSNFKFGFRGETTIVTKLQTSVLQSEARPSGLCVMADPIFEDTQSPVRYLPFELSVFSRFVQDFSIHPRITRTIGREICYFSCQYHSGEGDMIDEGGGPLITLIACTARTSSQIEDDLALSSTFFPSSGFSVAIVYGCNDRQKREITKRIEACDLNYNHPLLLPGLLFELERVRLGGAVEDLLDHFALKGSSDRELDLDMDKARMTTFLKSSYRSRELVNQVRAVKRQLDKMADSTRAAERSLASYQPQISQSSPEFSSNYNDYKPKNYGLSLVHKGSSSSMSFKGQRDEARLWKWERAGRQIRARLADVAYELDDKIMDCNMVTDNMSLTMQTVWNHFARQDNQTNLRLSRVNTELARTNTGLSQDMRRDSSQMRSIALLTMIFLPLSTVASIFSTTFFTWDAGEGESIISSYFWIFVVIAVALTGVVVGAWHLTTRTRLRAENKEKDRMMKKEAAWSEMGLSRMDEESMIGMGGGSVSAAGMGVGGGLGANGGRKVG
ncbi:hypothetical protein B0T17DRAFT_497941 [Bombardia bombarda]|uniref:Uncharacterized protein n=1 Tax=Bombardia bombarda TaxID=252184 RepID=A0AA40BV95_9PEZI|nr:hypothetical protein B0T17DRAFT_497941 [Bombardia bombarda]